MKLKILSKKYLWLVIIFVVPAFILLAVFSLIFKNKQTVEAATTPQITSAPASIQHKQSITIQGSGFGANGPTVVIFDDFEKGTNGNIISTATGSASVNEWDQVNTYDKPRYSNIYAHSGSLSDLLAWDEVANAECDFGIVVNFPTRVTGGSGVYFSYWMFIPSGGHVPGSAGGMENWKLWVVYGSPFGSDHSSPYTQTLMYDTLPTDFFLCPVPWYDESGRDYMDDDWGVWDPGYCPLGMNKGHWHRMEVYLLAGSSKTGAIGAWELNANLPRRQVGYQTGLTTISPSTDYWDTFAMPAYGRCGQYSNPLTKTYYDDVYVAVGPAARARVEIGNAPTYSSSTNMAVFTPTSWSSTSITATAWLGSFTSGQTAYLYVVDSNGNVNENGYPVTIGSGSSDTTPPVRSNGQPTGNLSSSTTSTQISLTTNEASTCKYSTTSGVAYSSITNTFSNTGGTSHSTTVSGLTSGKNYNYYIRCIDSSGNYNTNDYAISFGINPSTPQCSEGQITQTCLCGGVSHSSGYCCSNIWQSTTCTTTGKPSISSVSGNLQNKQSVTISGSGFGTKNPAAPVIWEDFEDTSWDSDMDVRDGVSTDSVSADQRAGSTKNVKGQFHAQSYISVGTHIESATKWYGNIWFKLSDNFVWGRGDSPNTPCGNIKFFRIWDPYSGGTQNNFVMAWWSFSNQNTAMETCEYSGDSGSYISMSPINEITVGNWHNNEFEYLESGDIGLNNGQIRYWFDSILKHQRLNVRTRSTSYPAANKHLGQLGLYASWTEPSTAMYAWLDNAYIDTTWARVMLGDKPTFSSCTHREIQIPTAWSSSSITFTANQGSFANGATVYLYVVDADGNVNASGYPVTLGSGGADTTPPSAPAGVMVE